MTDQLNRELAADSAACEGNALVPEEAKLEHLPNGIEDKENHLPIPADLPTPGSFSTPLETPSDQVQKTLEPEPQLDADSEPQIDGLKTPMPTQAATAMDPVPTFQPDLPTVDSDLKQAVQAPTADANPQPQSEEAAEAEPNEAIAQSEYYEARQT